MNTTEWRKLNPEKAREQVRRYRANLSPEKKEKRLKQQREYRKKRRLIVLEHYSGGTPRCASCGDETIEHLAIDHINNDGNEHRRRVQVSRLAGWIIRNNFPNGFQILCNNCNCVKAFHGEDKLRELAIERIKTKLEEYNIHNWEINRE